VCLTKSKNNKILLDKISHRFLGTKPVAEGFFEKEEKYKKIWKFLELRSNRILGV
jgi:hypothetical protein